MNPHHAPPVRYPAGRSSFLAWPLTLLGLVGATLAGVAAVQGLRGAPLALLTGTLLAAGAFGWSGWRALRNQGELHWDGAAWYLEFPAAADERPGTVSVQLDLQSHLLLRWRPAAGERRGGHWLWLDARQEPAHWHAVRCAVYSPASSPAAGDPS